ncbi:MAG: hypothetical protein FJ356_00730 [Thaumarchaeota archaeon]|nr:hypothetical protein [Nitrososphaerota archaeon]
MVQETEQEARNGKFYTLFVDGVEYHVEQQFLTGAQIMDLAGIQRDLGLIQILEDGTEKQIRPDEVVEFEGPGRRFKKAPRFKRG